MIWITELMTMSTNDSAVTVKFRAGERDALVRVIDGVVGKQPVVGAVVEIAQHQGAGEDVAPVQRETLFDEAVESGERDGQGEGSQVDPQGALIASGVALLQGSHQIRADEAGPDADSGHGHRQGDQRPELAPCPAPIAAEEKGAHQPPELRPDVAGEFGRFIHRDVDAAALTFAGRDKTQDDADNGLAFGVRCSS
jgi:hypothetical protein